MSILDKRMDLAGHEINPGQDGLPSGASNPLLKGQNATGQIVRYLNRTYRLLPTLR